MNIFGPLEKGTRKRMKYPHNVGKDTASLNVTIKQLRPDKAN